MTGIRIRYKGQPQIFNVYQIPLEYLIYNKYNGRIGSAVKSYEKESHELNPEVVADKETIEKFLWESKADRNQITKDDLAKNTQREYGIVTADGMIIDGNRRAFLLNRIYRNEREAYKKRGINVEHCQFFVAVILPLDADKKEVMKLETVYQMGEDKKLDFNPIEKYLKCKDLKAEKFSDADIAEMMNEQIGKIKEWLETLKLMEDYLDCLGYEGIYTRLDKTEDLFLNLNKAMKSYKNGKGTKWSAEDLDLNELKLVAYDFIRIRYEGKRFRDLVGARGNKGVFGTSPDVWKEFLKEHREIKEKHPEKTLQDMRVEYPNRDISEILEERDKQYSEAATEDLVKNLEEAAFKVDAVRDKDKPIELANKAIDLIESIDRGSMTYCSGDVLILLKRINDMVQVMIEDLELQNKPTKESE